MYAPGVLDSYAKIAKTQAYTRMNEPPSGDAPLSFSPTQIEDRADFLLVQIPIPGLSPESFEVEATSTKVVISAEWLGAAPREGTKPVLRSFRRVIATEGKIDAAGVEAQYSGGALRVYVPKLSANDFRKIRVGDRFSREVSERLRTTGDTAQNPCLEAPAHTAA